MTEIKNKPYTMAILSGLAYGEPSEVSKKFRKHGFHSNKYCSKNGAQCYIVWNDTNAVICFRGTEPKEMSDIKADLNAIQRQGLHNKGDVHGGFQGEINKLWDLIVEKIDELKNHKIYITGHSLGGAMATICAKRLQEQQVEVQCLYTYGSPRVGDKRWVKSLQIPHYRFQNNNDVVCKVPFWIMGYRHHGKNVYIGYNGKIAKMNMWRRFIDSMRGRFKAWSKWQFFDGIYDHNITSYTKRVKGYDV
tara:strand:- start:19 stop:762 length:744 start_codon:yes stop_codon:yes gene_type:complete